MKCAAAFFPIPVPGEPPSSDRSFAAFPKPTPRRPIVSVMDEELRKYEKTEIWNEVLCFRPHLQPGHDGGCPGISEKLQIREDACPRCRSWLDLLLRRGIIQ